MNDRDVDNPDQQQYRTGARRGAAVLDRTLQGDKADIKEQQE